MITGKHIQRFRHLRNYKQEYVAQKMGISVRTYRKLENEEIPLIEERKKAALEALDTTAEALLLLDIHAPPRISEDLPVDDLSSIEVLYPSEKELYERLLHEKEARIRQKEAEILFLRDILNRSSDSLL